MSKFVGDNNSYIIVRKINGDIEQVASIDDYNGSIYWTDSIQGGSRFDTLDKAKKLLNLQEEMAVLLDKEYKFTLLEENRVIKIVEE